VTSAKMPGSGNQRNALRALSDLNPQPAARTASAFKIGRYHAGLRHLAVVDRARQAAEAGREGGGQSTGPAHAAAGGARQSPDAEVESVTLSDALKCSLGIPPGAIPKCWLWGSHHANSNAAGFDLSQGIMNEGVAFYLVFDRRDVVWFNREFAATA